MENSKTKISYSDLGMIISSFYFNDYEGRFENTEDLIDFLTNEENADAYIVLSSNQNC